jgi:hypothetical protein
LRTPEDRRLKPVAGSPLLLWRGEDSNLRRHTPADLQSAPFGRLGTSPHRFSPRISFRRALELPCSTSPGAGLNRRPRPYQGRALPTELPGHGASTDRGQRARAGDGNRTRDVQLGRLMLYQLSYSRDPCAPLPAQSRRPESNRRPADYKSAALPSELRRPTGYLSANVVVRCSPGSDTRGGKRLSSRPAVGRPRRVPRAGAQLTPGDGA